VSKILDKCLEEMGRVLQNIGQKGKRMKYVQENDEIFSRRMGKNLTREEKYTTEQKEEKKLGVVRTLYKRSAEWGALRQKDGRILAMRLSEN
jgi:hypothetical protein